MHTPIEPPAGTSQERIGTASRMLERFARKTYTREGVTRWMSSDAVVPLVCFEMALLTPDARHAAAAREQVERDRAAVQRIHENGGK